MQLITAAWVVPITRPPIRNGAVLVDGDTIVAVGTARELAADYPAAEIVDLGSAVVTPGLVNAHTHLALTAAAGLLGPDEFPAWIAQIPRVMQAWSSEDLVASAALGAQECLEAGVTVVGEIVYNAAAAEAVTASGLAATLYWEILGIPPEQLEEQLGRVGFPAAEPSGPRWRAGLSPHAPYTSGPGLLAAASRFALDAGIPFAIHVAESVAETNLMMSGRGPLAEVAARLAPDFTPPETSSIAYLDRLHVLDDALAVHACEATDTDVVRLAASARAVVVCPRSNQWLQNRKAPAEQLASLRVPIAVGTDSAASNEDLDLLEDLRVLQRDAPALSASRLLRSVTADAAFAIGMQERFGALEPHLAADLAAFNVGLSSEPEASVVAYGGRDSLVAVMTAGTWRVREGRSLADKATLEAATLVSREKAAMALGVARL